MAEAVYLNPGSSVDYTPVVAVTAGEVRQLPDGRAGFAPTEIAAAKLGALSVEGIVTVSKTASMVMLAGSQVYWDASANAAHLLQVNDTDFFLGTVQTAATSAATTVDVAINMKPQYTITLGDGFWNVPVVTAGLMTYAIGHNEGVSLVLDVTAEAQKQDALSNRAIAKDANCLVEALICVNLAGDNAALDFNVGLANATHADDADSITESLFCHIDGASANIYFESDDKGVAEEAAADSTVDFTAGTPFLVQWDMSDHTDIQVYIDGVNVLPAEVYTTDGCDGPLKLLAHVEKGADNSPGNFTIARLSALTFTE